jgi:hypothetical protein
MTMLMLMHWVSMLTFHCRCTRVTKCPRLTLKKRFISLPISKVNRMFKSILIQCHYSKCHLIKWSLNELPLTKCPTIIAVRLGPICYMYITVDYYLKKIFIYFCHSIYVIISSQLSHCNNFTSLSTIV